MTAKEKLEKLGFPPDLIERSRVLSELGYRTMINFATIRSATKLDAVGLKNSFLNQASGFAELVLSTGIISGVKNGTDAAKTMDILSTAFVTQSTQNVQVVLSAACVVLAQSVADDVFSECCSIAVDSDKSSWAKEIDMERSVSLKDAIAKGPDVLLQEQLTILKSQLKNKSLPNRADALFRHVPIRQHSDIAKDDPRYFRTSKLKEVDDLRHQIVHSGGMGSVQPAQASEAVEFLAEACNTAIRSLCYGYNIPVEPGFMLPELFKPTAPPER